MPQQRTYEVTAPDGRVLEVTGPAGASNDEVVAQAMRLYQPIAGVKGITTKGPVTEYTIEATGKTLPLPTAMPDSRVRQLIDGHIRAETRGPRGLQGRSQEEMGGAELAKTRSVDAVLTALERAGVDPSSPVMGTLKNLGKGAIHTMGMGTFGYRMQHPEAMRQTAEGLVEPYRQIASGDPEQMTKGAAGFLTDAMLLGGGRIGGRAGEVSRAAVRSIDPAGLQLRANALRETVAATPPISAESTLTGILAQVPMRVMRQGAAAAQEWLARAIANRQGGPPVSATIPTENVPPTPSPQRIPQDYWTRGPEQRPAPNATIESFAGPAREGPPAPMAQSPQAVDTAIWLKQLQQPTTGATPEAAAAVNKWMNVRPNDVAHGANPGMRLLNEKLIGVTKEATKTNVQAAMMDAGAQLEAQLRNAKGVTIDASEIVQEPLVAAIKRIGAPRDATFQGQIAGILDDIMKRYPNISKLTPLESHRLKVELGDAITWQGAAASEPVNQAMLKIYRGLNAADKSAVPGLADLQSRWGDLYIANKKLAASMDADVVGRGSGPLPPKP